MSELTAKTRNSLGEGDFALPGRRYPIHDEAHARNALARVAQHGDSGEKSRVRSAVHARFPDIQEKAASMSDLIVGSVSRADFADFEAAYADEAVQELLPKCAHVNSVLAKIAMRLRPDEVAKVASTDRHNVVQVRPTRYGYMVKWAAAPDGTKPQEKEVSAPQAQQALPPEVLQAADEQGVGTVTDVQAEPDPLVETPQPIEGFGLYKVVDAATGKEIVGFVIPTLFDPMTGQPAPMKLFVNGGQFALQPDMQGVLVGVSYNLPSGPAEPRGTGIFYKTDGKSIIATVPYTVMTSVTVEGTQYYAAQTMDGMEVQIAPSDGIRKPTMVPIPGQAPQVAVPIDYTWLPLDNEIEVMGMTNPTTGDVADPMAVQKQASMPTMAEIRAWRDEGSESGGVRLGGPVFAKHGSGTYDLADAVFWLAAAGCPQNLSVALIDKAASSQAVVKIYGLHPLSPEERAPARDTASEKVAEAVHRLVPRPCLLKEAMAIEMVKEAKQLVGVDSLDTLLAVGLINPENIQDFVESIPALEETQSKLASLVLAVQMGLQSVPKTAAVRAMNSLEDVIRGLKGLKTYQL